MKIEIRSSNDATGCRECGATELVYSGGKPIAKDLTRVMEREIIRRELGMARMMRDHLDKADEDAAEREVRMAQEFANERWQLATELEQVLVDAKVDVPAWRVWRRRRERIFSERIDETMVELRRLTRFGNS